jgi:hypothetical protein
MLDGTRQQVLCYHTFMAKRKSKDTPPKDYSNLFVAGKAPVPQEGLGLPGKTYNVPSYAVKTLSLPQPNTPVVRDSGLVCVVCKVREVLIQVQKMLFVLRLLLVLLVLVLRLQLFVLFAEYLKQLKKCNVNLLKKLRVNQLRV